MSDTPDANTQKRLRVADALEEVANYAATHFAGSIGPETMRTEARDLRRQAAREMALPMTKLLPAAVGPGIAPSVFGPDGNGHYWKLAQAQLSSGGARGRSSVVLDLVKVDL
ncbi:hypothetical protein [Prescottella equi]|uniref:hypothetical protein n=1 Tax=Rhodococcus hoagii TaxID=43767 RepID=UPI000D10E967|nr:hypothetical protein [Prescottella equi]AVP71259.1 hypothetical protein C7H75_24565 [Prescottella equi]